MDRILVERTVIPQMACRSPSQQTSNNQQPLKVQSKMDSTGEMVLRKPLHPLNTNVIIQPKPLSSLSSQPTYNQQPRKVFCVLQPMGSSQESSLIRIPLYPLNTNVILQQPKVQKPSHIVVSSLSQPNMGSGQGTKERIRPCVVNPNTISKTSNLITPPARNTYWAQKEQGKAILSQPQVRPSQEKTPISKPFRILNPKTALPAPFPSGLVPLEVLPDQQDQELLKARQRADEEIKSEKRKETPEISPLILLDSEDNEDDIIDLAEDSDGPAEVSDSDFSDEDFIKPESDSDSALSDDFVIEKKKKLKNKSLSLSLRKKDHSTDDNKIREILPPEYLYIIEESSKGEKDNNFCATVRVNITTGEEAKKWLDAFELVSNTNFRVKKTWNIESSKRVVFKKKYRCHHNTLAEKSKSKNPHEKHIQCPAELIITVNHQGMRWSTDPYLKSHPCKVTIKHVHNHQTLKAFGDVLRHRRPCAQVRETFTEMFTNEKARITPVQAMEMHVSNLEKNDPNRHSLGDGALCPEMSWVYKLFNKIMKTRCGEPYGPEMIASLEKNIEEYNLECKDTCAKLGSTSDGKHHFVSICSPMMKRVLTHHKASGEVMFMDSSGSMDQCNARIFVILTASVVCGLPEGLMITFSETEEVVTAALKLWTEIIPSNAFYGRGRPKLIYTDDAAAERNSLRIIFPDSILLLCIFHVLQAMWRYIWDSTHKVPFEDKPYIYYLFRQLLYAPTVEEFKALYEETLEDHKLKQYELVLNHIKDLYCRAREWALCFRQDLISRGHQTNNFSEVLMRIMKDCVLGRTKAYNTVQLFNLLMNGLDNYYKRKLALVVNNRMRSCRSRLRVDPSKLRPLVAEKLFTSEHLYKVKNTEKNTEYIVDTELEICSCPVGKCGAPCKHQLSVVKKFKVSHQQFLPTNDASFKMVLYYIMTGELTAPDGFFDTLKGDQEIVAPIEADAVQESLSSTATNQDAMDNEEVGLDQSSDKTESLRGKIFEMAEDLLQKISGSEDYLAEPLDKFLKSYWAISKRNDSDSTLGSALATFGKDQSVLKCTRIGRKQNINIQPTSLAKRVHQVKGKQAQRGGRPRGVAANKATDHAYNTQPKKRKPTPEEPSWACPPRKTSKLPHCLSRCVEVNVRLPK